MTNDNPSPLAGALDRMTKTHFARLQELGINPMGADHTDVPVITEFETDREEAMYHAGRISGLCEARALLEDDTE